MATAPPSVRPSGMTPSARAAVRAGRSQRRGRTQTGPDRSGRAVRAVTVGLLLCWPLAGGAGAAPGSDSRSLAFQRWGREHGLPEDAVTALLQTRDGYLWVGTTRGLVRFDGVRFEPLAPPVGEPFAASDITSLCQDEAGRLWIGTQQHGLYQAAEPAQQLTRISAPAITTVNALAVERDQYLWVGTPDGLFRLNLQELSIPAPPVPGLPDPFVANIHVARSGMIWITTRTGLCQYRRGRIVPVEFDAESLSRSPEFIGMYEDRRGNLWAFGDTYLVNLSEGKRFNYFRGGDAAALRIWSLCEGRQGELWIGTSGQGLFAFADGRFRPLTLREGRLPSDVRAICEDREGNLWLGTFGGGLVRLRPRREQIWDAAAGLPAETVACLAANPTGEPWIGYERAGLFAVTGSRSERRSAQRLICAMALAPDGTAWVGTAGDGLFHFRGAQVVRFNTTHGLASDVITAVAVETNGAVCVATGAGTLHQWRGERWETLLPVEAQARPVITTLLAAPSGQLWAGAANGTIFCRRGDEFRVVAAAAPLAGAEIRALDEDALGRLWVGTSDRGLACLTNDRLLVWDQRHGLPGNEIRAVLVEAERTAWVLTLRGVYRLAWPTPTAVATAPPAVSRILESDDAARLEPGAHGSPQAARAAEGRLWFALPGRVVQMNPSDFTAAAPSLPVYIEKVLANGARVSLPRDARPVRLPARLDSLEIRFTALSLTEPEKVRFQHRLEGFEPDWMESGPERRVRYGRLPHGRYTFRLRARNADGVWSDTQPALAFIYPPPWWRAPAALAAYGIAAIAGVVVLVRAVSHRRLRARLAHLAQQQAMARERMRIAQDMHDEIGSKLAKISYLGELARHRPAATAESIDAIAATSRDLLQALDEIVWAVNPRNDSLEHLAVYLGHYATEYLQNTPLELELDIPRDLPAVPLSAEIRHNLFLAFQEALANALKHSGGTKLQVTMHAANGRFAIRVRDNGRGIPPELLQSAATSRASAGNGLVNLRQRLADIGGQCRLERAPDRGTIVTLDLRLPAGRTPST